MLPEGPDWPLCLDGNLKSHRGISFSLILSGSPHQVGTKNVFKTSSDFFAISVPQIPTVPDPSCMSHMEARTEVP